MSLINMYAHLIGGGGGWTPAYPLRAGGVSSGYYLDFSNVKNMFQDMDQQVPVTKSGDPVAYIRATGGRYDGYQDTPSRRPTYMTDGELHWLEFDGVDDQLLVQGYTGNHGRSQKIAMEAHPDCDQFMIYACPGAKHHIGVAQRNSSSGSVQSNTNSNGWGDQHANIVIDQYKGEGGISPRTRGELHRRLSGNKVEYDMHTWHTWAWGRGWVVIYFGTPGWEFEGRVYQIYNGHYYSWDRYVDEFANFYAEKMGRTL